MHILVIDIGGTNAKVWKTGEDDKLKIPTGKEFSPQKLVEEVRLNVSDWDYDRVSIGYPGHVTNGHPSAEAANLGSGWVGFDYPAGFGCPVRIMNDACMQALGSYEGGRMLYMGLGTGLGSTFIIDGTIVPLSLGHLKLQDDETLTDHLSRKALESRGPKAFRESVNLAAVMLKDAFQADYVVIGGGNAKKLKELPEGVRRGGNHNAYFGGLRMWEDASKMVSVPTLTVVPPPPAEAANSA
ncbi:MAG: ROK family protein [Planctomycetales bacterium]|nr:ROK family protein [Planctomycetales bacterium]